MTNQRGQSFLETLTCLPLLILLMTGLFFIFYFFTGILWSKHWIYRANICLAQKNQIHFCKTQLHQKLQVVLSKKNYRLEEFWKSPKACKVKVRIQLTKKGAFRKDIQSELSLPLRAPRSEVIGALPWFF